MWVWASVEGRLWPHVLVFTFSHVWDIVSCLPLALQLPGLFLSLPHLTTGTLGLQMHATVPSFYMASGDPNLGTHVFVVSSVPTEALPQPYTTHFYRHQSIWKSANSIVHFPHGNPPADSHPPGSNPQNPCYAFTALPRSLNLHVAWRQSTLEHLLRHWCHLMALEHSDGRAMCEYQAEHLGHGEG